jgi:ubiquinone/menaquinone biosynthesis C-methylase UbiE
MSKYDAWSNPSAVSKDDVIKMAAFLEERSHSPDMGEVNQKLCELVAPRHGEYILEVGSGSGVLCRKLTPFVLPMGVIIGIDISCDMSIRAREYALETGNSHRVDFGNAAVESLPFPDNSFDRALAARVLLHVSDPIQAIRELKRVVKPAGRVVVMDWDYDTVTVDSPDREMTRKILHWRNDHHGGNNWSGRQLWRQMNEAGLHDITVHPCVLVAYDESYGLTQSLWRAAQVACEGGAITEKEKDEWINELKTRIQLGTFFASIVYFIVLGNVTNDKTQV